MSDSASQHMQCMEVWGGSELTSRSVEMGGLEAWIYSKPFGAAKGGGDVYYASSCATGRIHRLLLADVAGHGQAVAETAVGLRKLMRRYVNFLDQGQFVRSMNRQFAMMSQDGCFATAVVTTFFAPTRRFSICNAGHPRPLLYRAEEKRWRILEHAADARSSGARGGEELQKAEEAGDLQNPPGTVRNIPLGIVDLADYEQIDVELEVGDLVLCYTDALIESRDAAGEFLGEEGLLAILQKLDGSAAAPELLIDALLKAVGETYPGNLSNDDVTALLLRPSGNAARVTMRDRVRGFTRLLGAMVRGINPWAERPPLPDLRIANIGGAIFPGLSKRWRADRRGDDQPADSSLMR